MAGTVRATQTYYAGAQMVKEGTLLSEGDARIVEAYVEAFGGPEPVQEQPKRRGRPPKEKE